MHAPAIICRTIQIEQQMQPCQTMSQACIKRTNYELRSINDVLADHVICTHSAKHMPETDRRGM